MLRFRDMRIRMKFRIVVLAACVLPLFVSAAVILTHQAFAIVGMISREVQAHERTLSEDAAAAALSGDTDMLTDTLVQLTGLPHAIAAAIYDKNGTLLRLRRARVDLPCHLPRKMSKRGRLLRADAILVFTAAEANDKTACFIGVQVELSELYDRLRETAKTVSLIVLIAALVGLLFVSRIENLLTSPLLALANTARQVSQSKDYSRRAAQYGRDEMGEVAESFNAMMAEIQKRDTALKQAHDELEDRVMERTRDMQQENAMRRAIEKRQSKLLADIENVNRELADFAHVVSHDLKAPLRAIGSLAEWISSDYASKLDNEGREKLALLMSRTRRMHDLINAILRYSRAGREDDELADTDLNALVREVADFLAPPENVIIQIDGTLPTVRTHRTRISQVIQNLLSNAIKYGDKPRTDISISAVEDGDFWRISVKDNGPGIAPENFDLIFQMFQTLEQHRSSDSTGVGLAIAKKVVTLYGGQIWVDSAPGKGATFHFTLPKEPRSDSC